MSFNRYDNYDFINPLNSLSGDRPKPLVWYRCNMEQSVATCSRLDLFKNPRSSDHEGKNETAAKTEKDVSVCLHVPQLFHKIILEDKLGRSVEIIN